MQLDSFANESLTYANIMTQILSTWKYLHLITRTTKAHK